MNTGVDGSAQGQQLITADWLIDGSGAAVQHQATLVVRGGFIQEVHPNRPDRLAPSNCVHKVFAQATVLPLLLDAHVHLALSGRMEANYRKAQLNFTPEQVFQIVQDHLLAQWRCGVAAVRDAGDKHGAVRTAVRDLGSNPVLALATNWAWYAKGRYGGMIGQAVAQGTELASAIAGQWTDVDQVKIIQSGLNSLDRFGYSGAPQFSQGDLTRAVDLAHARSVPVMVHANGQLPVQWAIDAGCDSIEHGYFMGRDNLTRLVDRQCIWVPTAVPMSALLQVPELSEKQKEVARRTLEHHLEQIALGHRLGVRIALGTDAGSIGVMHGEAVRQELALLQAAGMSIEQTVQCATGTTAQLMRLPDRGTLVPGQRADFIVVPGPPEQLADALATLTAVCQAGRWSSIP